MRSLSSRVLGAIGRMKFLSPRVHGVIDYVAALFFFFCAVFLPLPTAARTLSIVAAVVIVAGSIMTDYPLGVARALAYEGHEAGEMVFCVGLAFVGALFAAAQMWGSALIFLGAAGVLFVVWLLTDFTAVEQTEWPGAAGTPAEAP